MCECFMTDKNFMLLKQREISGAVVRKPDQGLNGMIIASLRHLTISVSS